MIMSSRITDPQTFITKNREEWLLFDEPLVARQIGVSSARRSDAPREVVKYYAPEIVSMADGRCASCDTTDACLEGK